MRKFLVSVLMMTLLLLSGCGEREARLERDFDEFRRSVTETENLTASVRLTAMTGGTVSEYLLSLAYDGSAASVTIAEPELLAGITAVAERGQTEIEYESVRLGAGALDETGLTPVSALPAVIDAVQSGYLELLWWEEPYLCARLHVSDSSVLTLWLEGDTITPYVAEIASDGRVVVRAVFEEWTIE